MQSMFGNGTRMKINICQVQLCVKKLKRKGLGGKRVIEGKAEKPYDLYVRDGSQYVALLLHCKRSSFGQLAMNRKKSVDLSGLV